MEFTCKKNKIHFEKWTCSTIFFSNYFTSKHKLKNNTSDPSFKKETKKAMLLLGFLGVLFTDVKDLQAVLSLKVLLLLCFNGLKLSSLGGHWYMIECKYLRQAPPAEK